MTLPKSMVTTLVFLLLPRAVLGCGTDETYLAHPVPSAGSGVGGDGIVDANEGGAAGATDAGDGLTPPSPVPDAIDVKGVQVPLKPSFDPEVHRYSVLASEPAGRVTVTVTAASELELWVAGREAKSGRPVELDDARPETEIEIEVRNSEDERSVYTLAYLPYDFPDITITTHQLGASTDPIYLAPRGGGRYYIAKLNPLGVPLFYEKMPDNVADFKKHPTGQYSYAQKREDGGWEHVVLDENFEEVTRVTTVGLLNTDSHEFHILPNGNYVVLAYERAVQDLTEFGGGSADTVVDAILQELSPSRDVLFQWNSWDHMSYGDTVYHRNDADYSHINSVFVDTDGNWILSSRGMAQVLKIDRTTGEVLWRLGGRSNEFTFIDDPFRGFCGQHTVTRVANGNLLLFDNGQSCWPEVPERGEFTRIVEYAIDERAKTAQLVFSFDREGAYTTSQGSAQRLANGNTLIGWGLGFTALATEVDREGDIVFELEGLMRTSVANSYRVYRFPE